MGFFRLLVLPSQYCHLLVKLILGESKSPLMPFDRYYSDLRIWTSKHVHVAADTSSNMVVDSDSRGRKTSSVINHLSSFLGLPLQLKN